MLIEKRLADLRAKNKQLAQDLDREKALLQRALQTVERSNAIQNGILPYQPSPVCGSSSREAAYYKDRSYCNLV